MSTKVWYHPEFEQLILVCERRHTLIFGTESEGTFEVEIHMPTHKTAHEFLLETEHILIGDL